MSEEPNEQGWHNEDINVEFSATDALSGLLEVSPALKIVAEGTNQEVVGTAVDLAGNRASIEVKINLDRTAPVISGLPGNECVLWPPNAKLIHVADVESMDDLSGVLSLIVDGMSSEPSSPRGESIVIQEGSVSLRSERVGNSENRVYTLLATAEDKADNVAAGTGQCTVPHDQGKAPNHNSRY